MKNTSIGMQKWQCPHCTFLNDNRVTVCAVCQRETPIPRRNLNSFQNETISISHDNDATNIMEIDQLSGECWQCPFCTFINYNLSGICEMCHQDVMGSTKHFDSPHIMTKNDDDDDDDDNKSDEKEESDKTKENSIDQLQSYDVPIRKDSEFDAEQRRVQTLRGTDEVEAQDQNVESEEKELLPNSSDVPQSSHCWQCPRCYTFYEDNPSEKCKFCPNNILKRETERNIIRESTECAQTDSNASIYRWNCHQCTLENIVKIQNISEMLTCSLCGYQSEPDDAVSYEVPVKESEYKSLSSESKQEDTASDKYEMNWFKIVNAVKHEMSPFIASALEQTLNHLNDKNGDWDMSELSDTAIDEVITRLQQNIALKTKDVDYLQRLIWRLLEPDQIQTGWWSTHEFTTKYTNPVEKEDFSTKWNGLNSSLLFDVFCVKKAHQFTFEQRVDYRIMDFENDVQNTERLWNLGEIGISHFVKSNLFRGRLQSISLYPRWLINDDLFECMKCIFGVTHFVDRLQARLPTGLRQRVHVYIIPKQVISLYDPQEMWEMENMSAIDQCLEHLECDAFINISKDIWDNSSVVEICDMLNDIHDRTRIGCDANIVILVDRRQLEYSHDESQTLWVYESEDLQELLALSWNNFLGFEFDIGDNAKCWIRFGFGQRVRFYPEFLTSFVPSLFVRPLGCSDMEYLEKIYDDQFKHGWAVPLDDPVFNLYYKAITGDDHISNNYNRLKNVKKQNIDRSLGFLEFLRRQMNVSRFRPLQQQLQKQDMDSDAVFDDLLVTQINGSVFIDVSDSNVARWTAYDTVDQLRSVIFRWENVQCKRDNPLDLRDCHHVNVVIDYLKTFQRHGNEITESNLNQFDLEKVVQSLDHITTVHRLLNPEYRAELHRYITEHVVCDKLKCCEIFKNYAERTRECDQSRIWKRGYKVNDAEERCMVIMDVMNTLHSLLIHRDQTLSLESRSKRFFNSKEEAPNEEEKEPETVTNSIDLGVSVIRWIPFGERPHFQCFRDEIVCNPHGSIDEQLFQQYLIECSAKIYGTTFTLKEMMALKLYTDTTKFTASMRKAHWTTSPLSCKKLYYFWASAVYEAALYHSAPLFSGNTNVPVTLYHGINRMFTVNEDLPKYNGPFSSTRQRTIAHEFTRGKGLYFRIQPSYNDKVKCCVGIKVENISCHQREREILLIDQYLPISSTKTSRDSDIVLVDYFISSVRGWKTEIKDSRGFFIKLGIRFNPQWMRLIGSHPELFKLSVYRNRLVITRLIEELKITDWHLSFMNPEVEHVKLVTHLVEQYEMKQLLPLYRVATSKFRVIQSSVIDHCFDIEFIPNIKMDHIGDTTTVGDTCFKETQYLINGVAVPYTISKVKGAVHCIQCRNPDLFGDRNVLIQEFQSSDDYDSLESEITDLVQNHNIYQLLPHYRVLTSKFNVVQSYFLGHCYRLKLVPNITMDDVLIRCNESIKDNYLSCFEESEYKINGNSVPHTVSSVKGIVRYIECRNTKLFGDRIVWMQQFEESDHQTMISEIVNLVECHELHQLLPHYRVITSKFEVVQSRVLNHCYHIKLVSNTKMDYIGDQETVNDSDFKETEYKINGNIMPYTVSSVNGAVRRIECRNIKLFGDINVWVQDFHSSSKSSSHDSIWSEIIDLVENHEVYQLLPHYRILTSKFKVLQSHAENKVFALRFNPNTKMDHIGDGHEDTVNDSCFTETEYKINGKVVPHSVWSVTDIVKRIECRNIKLFGDGLVWVQEFDDSQDAKEKKLGLAVFKERGHHAEHHPNNLFDGSQYTYYWSKEGNPDSDWIIFELFQKTRFYPTKLMIRNSSANDAIKSIVISWSVNGEEYHTSTRIDNIQKKWEEQWFHFEEKESRLVFALGKLQYLKVSFVDNHDSDFNLLHQFALFGFSA